MISRDGCPTRRYWIALLPGSAQVCAFRCRSIFPTEGAARVFELTSATTSATGVQICTYERAR